MPICFMRHSYMFVWLTWCSFQFKFGFHAFFSGTNLFQCLFFWHNIASIKLNATTHSQGYLVDCMEICNPCTFANHWHLCTLMHIIQTWRTFDVNQARVFARRLISHVLRIGYYHPFVRAQKNTLQSRIIWSWRNGLINWSPGRPLPTCNEECHHTGHSVSIMGLQWSIPT